MLFSNAVSYWKKRNSYFNKAHPDGTHLGKLIYHLKAVINRLGKQLGKELVVENLQAAATGDLADSCWVEAMLIVTVAALHKNAAVTHALSIYLSSNVIEVNTCKEGERNDMHFSATAFIHRLFSL